MQLEVMGFELHSKNLMAYLRGDYGDPTCVFQLQRMLNDAVYAFGEAQGERTAKSERNRKRK